MQDNTPPDNQDSTQKQQSPEKHLSIGKASKHIGVSVDTLRRWEKKGRLNSHRSPGGHRYFKKHDLEKVFDMKYTRSKPTKQSNQSTQQPPPKSSTSMETPSSPMPGLPENLAKSNQLPKPESDMQPFEESPIIDSTQPTDEALNSADNIDIDAILNSTLNSATDTTSTNHRPRPKIIVSEENLADEIEEDMSIPKTEKVKPAVSILTPIKKVELEPRQEEKLTEILEKKPNSKKDSITLAQKIGLIAIVIFVIVDIGLVYFWYVGIRVVSPIP